MKLLVDITNNIDLRFNIIDITSLFEKRIATGTRTCITFESLYIKNTFCYLIFTKVKSMI